MTKRKKRGPGVRPCHDCRTSYQPWLCDYVSPPIYLCPNCMRSRLAAEREARVKAQEELEEAQWARGPKAGGRTWGSDERGWCPRCWNWCKCGHAADCTLAAALKEPE